MKRKGALIGLAVIVAALAFSVTTFRNSLINYVPFSEARAATDDTVQIMGAPVAGTMDYDTGAQELRFDIADGKGSTMPVVFKGPKPDDLDSAMAKATKITAQGVFDPKQQAFVADNLLVKCPSKYQGAPGGGDRHYGAT